MPAGRHESGVVLAEEDDHGGDVRLRSYELIAEEFGLERSEPTAELRTPATP